jgi:hypothetical protein
VEGKLCRAAAKDSQSGELFFIYKWPSFLRLQINIFSYQMLHYLLGPPSFHGWWRFTGIHRKSSHQTSGHDDC